MKALITSIIDINRAPNGRLHYLIEGLSERHDLTVICPYDTWRPTQTDVGEYGSVDRMADERIDLRYLTDRNLSPILQDIFAEVLVSRLDIDIASYDVHLDYSTLFLGNAVGRRAESAGVPTLYDLMDDVVAMTRDSPQLVRPLDAIGGRTAGFLLGRNIARARHVTYTTEALREARAIPETKSTCVPNGVDTELFSPAVEACTDVTPATDFTVGYVGTNREWVDLPLVIESVARLREDGIDAGVLIVGEEGGLDGVRRRARELGIEDACSFAGTVPYPTVPSYLTAMDVGTVPFKPGGIGDHSLPLKLFEYMACGLPVASTPIGGVEDAAGDVVAFGQGTDGYTDALGSLLADEDRRSNLGREGRKLVEREYSWVKQVDRIDHLLEGIV